MNSDAQLELDNITVGRGEIRLIEAISFTVKAGDAIQILGENGSGKSSLLSIIAGVLTPIEGRINWRGAIGDENHQCNRESCIFVGHDTPNRPALSVRENLAYWARIYAKKADRVAGVIEQAGLKRAANQPSGQLSAGQKRRLELARCLLAGRQVWLLDEPTTSLDSSGHDLWSEQVRIHQEKGGMSIIATHKLLNIQSRDLRLA